MIGTFPHRMVMVVVVIMLVLTSGSLVLAAPTLPVQPIQPLQPLATEEPGDRSGTIPTIDPDSDLPTRPSLPTPTPNPARFTPTPDVPVGMATSTQAPPTEAVEPTPTLETQALEVETANLTIHKGICPKDDPTSEYIDPYGDHGIQAFIDTCPLVTTPIEFDVSGSDGFGAHVDTGIGGEVQIGVPAGPLSVSEVLPEGVTVPAVFCFSDKVPLQADAPATFSPFANWEAQPGEQVECWFFNIRDTARFVIIKRLCPEGVSPLSDQLNPWTYCTEELPGTEFIVTDANGEHAQTTTDDSSVSWEDLQQRDDGTITVREIIPDGYGEPAFFCGPRHRLNAGDELDEYVPSQNGEITRSFSLPGQTVDGMCVVFNTTVGAETGHDITILKLACPDGYDDTNVPFETLVDDCVKFPGLVEFTISDGGGVSVTEQTVSPDLPFALFDNIPAGPITITETVPNGYAPLAVWCSDEYGGDEALTNITSQSLVDGNSIAWDYADGSRLACVWLNIPTGDVPVGDNVVTIHKWRCNVEDTGLDPDWPLDNLLATCTEAMNDVEFTLTAPNGASTHTTANGTAEWTGLPEGNFSIQEAVPEYYDYPVVFCGISIPNGGGPMVQVASADGLVEASFGALGSAYTCHWFNIDLGEYSIRIYKHICPDEVLYGGSLDHYQSECTVPMPNLTFDVTHGQGTISGDTNFVGILVLSPIPAGPFSIQENIPDGYGEPVVFCEASAGYGGQQIVEPVEYVDTTGGALGGDMPQGGHIDCWWFNIQDTPNQIDLAKWECPDEAGPKTADWYMTSCSQKLDGIDFTLTTTDGATTATTANGVISFQGVRSGPVGLQETIPPQYGEAAAVCDVNGAWELFPTTNGYVSFELGGGQLVSCHWFNTSGGPGDITIVKHTCLARYDPHAAGADPSTDCPELTDGVEFTLGGPASATSTTGDVMPGVAHFGDLDPGLYTVTETIPAGIASVFVTECTGHLMGELQPYPLSTDESLDIDLAAGEHITCHWFNVLEQDGGTVTVIKYTCSTIVFVSEVDCQIEEDGVTFDLLASQYRPRNCCHRRSGTPQLDGARAWRLLAGRTRWRLVPHPGHAISRRRLIRRQRRRGNHRQGLELRWRTWQTRRDTHAVPEHRHTRVLSERPGPINGTLAQRTTLLVVVVVLLLGSGGLALAQTLPVQPIQPLATEEPDDRSGIVPTLDPDSDLPTRPSLPTPTPHPARQTPVPTSDIPLGVSTTTLEATEPVEPTSIAPNPQPNQPTIPPDTQPTPANATITISGMVCPDDYRVIAPYWIPNHSLSEYQEACAEPANSMIVVWGMRDSYYLGNQGITTGDAYTITVSPGEVGLRTGVTMRYQDGSSNMTSVTFCTSNLRPYPWTLFPPEGEYTYVLIDVAPGEHLQCVRYLEVYAPAEMAISMWTCPPGFDPTVAGAKPRTACQRGHEGAPLQTIDPVFGQVVVGEPQGPQSIFGPQSTVVVIGPLPRFRNYEVTLPQTGAGSNLAGSFTMGCTQDGLTRGNVQTLHPEHSVLACDWFVVPAGTSGSIRWNG